MKDYLLQDPPGGARSLSALRRLWYHVRRQHLLLLSGQRRR